MNKSTVDLIRLAIAIGLEYWSIHKAAEEILALDRREVESRIALAEAKLSQEMEKLKGRKV